MTRRWQRAFTALLRAIIIIVILVSSTATHGMSNVMHFTLVMASVVYCRCMSHATVRRQQFHFS